MSLLGYDAGVEVSRAAFNKILNAFLESPVFANSFSGVWSSPANESGSLTTSVSYRFSLARPILIPFEFFDDTLGNKVQVSFSFNGEFRAVFATDGRVVHDFAEAMEGTAAFSLEFGWSSTDHGITLLLAFSDLVLQELKFPRIDKHVNELIRFVVQSLVSERVSEVTKRVPIFPPFQRELPFFGRLQSSALKSHWYKQTSGDMAASLYFIFDENSRPVPPERLLEIRRLDGGADVNFALSLRFLNFALSRALQLGPLLSHYGNNERPDINGRIRIGSVSVRVVDGIIRLNISIDWRDRGVFSIETHSLLHVENGRFAVSLLSVEGGVPGINNVILRTTFNALFLFAIWGIGQIIDRDIIGDIEQRVEEILNGRTLLFPLNGKIPGGPTVQLTPSRFQCNAQLIGFSFLLDCN